MVVVSLHNKVIHQMFECLNDCIASHQFTAEDLGLEVDVGVLSTLPSSSPSSCSCSSCSPEVKVLPISAPLRGGGAGGVRGRGDGLGGPGGWSGG